MIQGQITYKMADLIHFFRTMIGCRLHVKKYCVALTLLSLIMLLLFVKSYDGNTNVTYHINIFLERISPNTLKPIPSVTKYINPRLAIPITNTDELNPELKIPSSFLIGNKIILILFIMLLFPSAVFAAPIITDNHLNKMKVIHTLNTTGHSVLLATYHSEYVKPYMGTKNIKEHLIQDLGWTEAIFKKKFDKTMIRKIETSPNTGEEYDISLLLKCLRVLSEYYDPAGQNKWTDSNELEGRCKNLKDLRNDAFHSISGIDFTEMILQIDDIKKLLLDIMDSLKGRHPSETTVIDDKIRDINDNIADILRHDLSRTAINAIQKIRLQENMKRLKGKIPAYKDKCKEWGKVGILDFLMGSEKIHEIKTLFTEVVVEKSKFRSQNTKLKCVDIFNSGTDAILLIDSEAGGGKTTIFRYGISDWSNAGGVMNIDDYDLIFPMLFRNPHIKSVKELIKDLFPEASKEMDIDDIMDLISDPSLKIVFFCDGYDEKNPNSCQLFSEICELKRKYPHIRIVCTSRPESVKEFFRIVGKDHTIEHVKVLGIKESDRPAFLHRYHEEIIKAGLSKQSSKDLLDFYSTQSARHKELYRLPINLVILAWIWGLDPKLAKTIKSAAGLYNAILDIMNRKLIERIFHCHPDVKTRINGDVDELTRLIDGFKEIVYSESLNAITENRIYIDDKGVKRLKNFCTDNKLPYAELIGAFLFTKVSWENIGDLNEVLEVPHKGFLDYFASMCIASQLGHGKRKIKASNLFSITYIKANKIKKIILDYCHKNNQKLDMSRYQNIIQLLGGNLSLKDETLLEKYGKDIIDLLKESGVSNNTQWFDSYSDLNVNPRAAEKYGKLIAPNLNLKNFTIKDSDVDILSVLLQHVDIHKLKVTLDISNSTHKELPGLYDILVRNECEASISKIDDNTVEFWNPVLTSHNQNKLDIVKIENIELGRIKHNLPFLEKIHIEQIKLINLWRELQSEQMDMSKCDVERLLTAVMSTAQLPYTVTSLRLGLLTDASGDLVDPGLADLPTQCPGLVSLGVHLRAGSGGVTTLPRLTNDYGTYLFLSSLGAAEDLQWAVDAAAALQPPGGYSWLYLPSCGLSVPQLVLLMELMNDNNIEIRSYVCVSSAHSDADEATLEVALRRTLNYRGGLDWYQNDDALAQARPDLW